MITKIKQEIFYDQIERMKNQEKNMKNHETSRMERSLSLSLSKCGPLPTQIMRRFLTFIILIAAAPLLAAPVYVDNGDATVSDKATILVWQKCSMGQNNDATCSGTATTATWTNALAYCNGLTLAGKTWRLPNVNELESLVDDTKNNPAIIDTTAFPATVATAYWSSSTLVSYTTNAWFVNFNDSSAYSINKAFTYYVRCVATVCYGDRD